MNLNSNQEVQAADEGRKNDLFVHFVPCKVELGDPDINDFVNEIGDLHGSTMIVSNTIPAKNLSVLYEQPMKNVVGEDQKEDLASRIAIFGKYCGQHKANWLPLKSLSRTLLEMQ
ncbi:hypothetical protein COOONC_15146 [Cooperia oncophora]